MRCGEWGLPKLSLSGLDQQPFSLPPIADGVLKDVIEGPAQRDRKEHGANGLNIDPQLTDRLLRDWTHPAVALWACARARFSSPSSK